MASRRRKLATGSISGAATALIELGILITGDKLVAELNGRYRGRQETTDVLSFSLEDGSLGEGPFVIPPGGKQDLGEVIISYPQAARQALENGHEVKDELAFLTVHGVFHLLGHDHEEVGETELMQELETRALARLDIDRKALFPKQEHGD